MIRTFSVLLTAVAVAITPSAALAKGGGHKRTFQFAGTVKAVDATADTLVVTVVRGKGSVNKAARGLRGRDVTLDMSAARLKTPDANADGKRDLGDLVAGQRVQVLATGPAKPQGKTLKAKRVDAKKANKNAPKARSKRPAASDDAVDPSADGTDPADGPDPADGTDPADATDPADGDGSINDEGSVTPAGAVIDQVERLPLRS
jgi:hypothetical protein